MLLPAATGAMKVNALIDFQGLVARTVALALVSVACTTIVAPGPNAASAATLGEMRLLIPSSTNPARYAEPAVSIIQTAAGARCHGQIVGPLHTPVYLGAATAGTDGRVTLKGDANDHFGINPIPFPLWYAGRGQRILTVTCDLNGASATQEFRFDVQ